MVYLGRILLLINGLKYSSENASSSSSEESLEEALSELSRLYQEDDNDGELDTAGSLER
jgi:hypothetical protein